MYVRSPQRTMLLLSSSLGDFNHCCRKCRLSLQWISWGKEWAFSSPLMVWFSWVACEGYFPSRKFITAHTHSLLFTREQTVPAVLSKILTTDPFYYPTCELYLDYICFCMCCSFICFLKIAVNAMDCGIWNCSLFKKKKKKRFASKCFYSNLHQHHEREYYIAFMHL